MKKSLILISLLSFFCNYSCTNSCYKKVSPEEITNNSVIIEWQADCRQCTGWQIKKRRVGHFWNTERINHNVGYPAKGSSIKFNRLKSGKKYRFIVKENAGVNCSKKVGRTKVKTKKK